MDRKGKDMNDTKSTGERGSSRSTGTSQSSGHAGEEHSETHSESVSSGTSWGIMPNATPLEQLLPILSRLGEDLRSRNPTLTADQRQAIKRHITELVDTCLVDS